MSYKNLKKQRLFLSQPQKLIHKVQKIITSEVMMKLIKGVALKNIDTVKIVFELAKFNEALSCCDDSLRIFPNFYLASYTKGKVLMTIGKLKEAVKEIKGVLQHDPDFFEANLDLGLALIFRGKNYQYTTCKNVDTLTKKSKLKPKNLLNESFLFLAFQIIMLLFHCKQYIILKLPIESTPKILFRCITKVP